MKKKEFDGTFTGLQEEVLWLFIEARRILSDDIRAGMGSSAQVEAEAAAFEAAAKAGYDFNEDGGFARGRVEPLSQAGGSDHSLYRFLREGRELLNHSDFSSPHEQEATE